MRQKNPIHARFQAAPKQWHQPQKPKSRQREPGEGPRPDLQSAGRFPRLRASDLGRAGNSWAFVSAILVIVIWALTGHIFHYSDTWQLIINTGTTIVAFLMAFLIQNTQNRDPKAVHLKLAELIRAVGGARNHMVDLERLSDQELRTLQAEFERIGQKADAARADGCRGERRDRLTLTRRARMVAEVKEEIASR